jgi:hypothetical protein
MARPLRLDHPGAVWRITARGNECNDIVRDDTDRESFVELLRRCVEKYRWLLHSWTLMDNRRKAPEPAHAPYRGGEHLQAHPRQCRVT